MSRSLCKLARDALASLQVKAVKDGEDIPFLAPHVHETRHRSDPSTNFDEAPLKQVRRQELPPQPFPLYPSRPEKTCPPA